MGVVLRKRKLKKGYSYYLDLNNNGQRWREFLGAKIKKAKDKLHDKDIEEFVKALRAQREYELMTQGHNIPYAIIWLEDGSSTFNQWRCMLQSEIGGLDDILTSAL